MGTDRRTLCPSFIYLSVNVGWPETSSSDGTGTDLRTLCPSFIHLSVNVGWPLTFISDDTRPLQIEELRAHFKSSGYYRQKLQGLKQKSILKTKTPDSTNTESINEKSIVFPLYYFDGIQEFKLIVHDLNNDFKQFNWLSTVPLGQS